MRSGIKTRFPFLWISFLSTKIFFVLMRDIDLSHYVRQATRTSVPLPYHPWFVWMLLGAVLMLVPTGVQAQVHIKQVTSSSSIGSVQQGQLQVKAKDDVEPGDVFSLIPGGQPVSHTDVSGERAVISQEGVNNQASIDQKGSGNEAVVTQRGWKGLGRNNEASVQQKTSNNIAVITQKGRSNRSVIKQKGGTGNVAGIRLRGDNNRTNLLQNGTGNEYVLKFTGNGLGSNSTHTVKQIGNQNTLKQVGVGSKPFDVQQRGNGMKVIIRHTTP